MGGPTSSIPSAFLLLAIRGIGALGHWGIQWIQIELALRYSKEAWLILVIAVVI